MKPIVCLCLIAANLWALNREGLPGIHKTMSAKTLGHGNLGAGVMASISTDERVIRNQEFTPEAGGSAKIYSGGNLNAFSVYPFLSFGLSNYLDLSSTLPVYLDDIDVLPGMRTIQIGDLRYRIKLQIPYFAQRHVVDGAVFFGGSFPTTQTGHGVLPREIEYLNFETDRAATTFGYGKFAFNSGMALTVDFGELTPNFLFKWHNNAGVRRTFGVDEVLFYSTAFDYRFTYFLSGFFEFLHESRFDELGSSDEFKTEPTTLTFGGKVMSPVGLELQLGLSFALNDKYISGNVFNETSNSDKAYRYDVRVNPPLVAWMGIYWNGWLIPQDKDKDGVVDNRDACPEHPEDVDGYKDLDGCPDEDNDEDGVPDASDKCPNKPEDVDGFEDDDGCPDLDNDQDGVPDLNDGCPGIPEDMDGFEDADGCPEIDNDKDGVPDSTDKCPMVAEDIDGFEDADGCPDIDNDKDGIVDEKDKCPLEPETVNGVEDEDGCPDKKAPPIKNVVLKGINFKTGSAELTFESHATLDRVVEQLNAYPDVEIEIRGHTDNVGSEKINQSLSEQRAQAVVNYFVSKGIDSGRMRARGYGETQPVASNRTAEGRAENRRIEMYRTK